MFIGHYETKVERAKGRTALPSTFRKQIKTKAIITKGFEGSLILVKFQDWEKVIAQVAQENFLSGLARQTDRFLLGNAFEVAFDSQGRFIIPTRLRDYAKLGRQAIFAGVGNRIEIWDKLAWEKNDQYLNENIAQISEELDEKSRN
jgi:MraZ protein